MEPIIKDYSGLGQSAIILFYAAAVIGILLIPIITGVSLGIPNQRLKYQVQATIVQGASPQRFPHN
jgi:hypothetical protein